MMRSPGREYRVVAALLAAVVAAGCAPPADPASSPSAPADVAFAPNSTASRLQDLAGALLLFHGAHGRLPSDLRELAVATGLRDEQVLDPVNARPFVYAPQGVAAGSQGRTIVLLAAPEPDARACFGVSLRPSAGGLLADVVPFPAAAYETMRSASAGPPAP